MATMSIFKEKYDVLIIGAGVAGSHAAKAAAQKGAKTLLLTSSWDSVAYLGWGPKYNKGDNRDAGERRPYGAAVRKALIGAMKTRGAASVFIDNFYYQGFWKRELERQQDITIYQDTCEGVRRVGSWWEIETKWGAGFSAKAVVLALGTFLGARVMCGRDEYGGGRPGESGDKELAGSLRAIGLSLLSDERSCGPTVSKHGVEWSRLVEVGDESHGSVSYRTVGPGGQKVVLEPVNRERDQFYLSGLDVGDAINGCRGLKTAIIVRPGFRVRFHRLAHPGRTRPLGMGFAGQVGSAKSYAESARTGREAGLAAATFVLEAEVSRGT